MRLREILREPLIHFIVIGAALFGYSQWTQGRTDSDTARIVVTSGQIDHLAAGFTKAWRRPPTEDELKGLIDDWVREELAVRAARNAGLDRGDSVIRRRLRQRLEFMVEDLADASVNSEKELKAWYGAHRETLRSEARVAFKQIFLSPEQRGDQTESDAAAILKKLNSMKTSTAAIELGDRTMLPHEIPLSPLTNIDRIFGEGFVVELKKLGKGVWAGPFKSAYGLHLVLLEERVEGTIPDFQSSRAVVERELMRLRRERDLAEMYENLLANHTVVIERDGVARADAKQEADR